MGQITEAFVKQMLVHCERKEHPPLTVWEAEQLARAWLELERERMRLAACGVVALADTPESAAKAREMHEDYRSASCDDVARRVDECMALREDAARYRWLRGHLIGADFDWNESGASTLVFEIPKGLRISANCDKTIDDAMALTELPANGY